MKKYYIYIIIIATIFCIINILDSNNIEIEKIKYGIFIDGVSSSKFPERGAYNVEINCKNADATWNYNEWAVEVSNITTPAICNLNFKTKTKIYLNNYIKSLMTSDATTIDSSENNDGSTLEIVRNDYRYRGLNPNNYIMFNNELWRIIGVFDDNSHGVNSNYLVKIIRNETLGSIVWDNSNWFISGGSYYFGMNDYADSYIYKKLNNDYYESSNVNCITGMDRDNQHEGVTSSFVRSCDFSLIGPKEPYKSMIKNVTWYLGGYRSAAGSSDMYRYERSDNDEYYYHDSDWWSGAAININTKRVSGYVGLMYASDYGYAAPSTCTSSLGGYSHEGCADSNWLNIGQEWLITHSTERQIYGFRITETGSVEDGSVASGIDARPTLYLDSSVYYITGNGTINNPYIIGI